MKISKSLYIIANTISVISENEKFVKLYHQQAKLNNGLINFNGDVNQIHLKNFVKNGQLIVSFGEVQGSFDCSLLGLISLLGCPKIVYNDFNCSNNKLKMLWNCPSRIGGKFNCSNNQLKSLLGCPTVNIDDFNCSNNNLTSLEGCTEVIGGSFNCSNNNLLNLNGAPKSIGDSFDCSGNNLVDLQYCPKTNRKIDCSDNQLTSLKGIKEVKNNLSKSQIICDGNLLSEEELLKTVE